MHLKENLSRAASKLGKIIKVIESKDDAIRAATLLLPTRNTVNRPIKLLYPMQIATVRGELDGDPLPQQQV